MKRIIFFCTFLVAVFTFGFSQAKKPSIMIFPADDWMVQNGYTHQTENQGVQTTVFDYQKALNENTQLNSVIIKIQGMMNDRKFPLTDFASTLKSIAEQNALDNIDQNSNGGGIAESARDKMLKQAKPDIVLYIRWNVISTGPKKAVDFTLQGVDAGTNKSYASAGGTGQPSFSAEIPILLETAVLDYLDNFNVQLQTAFEDMVTNGREISLNIKVWDNSPKKLNDEINEDGDLLKDDIKKWVSQNTVKGRFTLASSSPNSMKFTQVRIPLYDPEGIAFDADGFATSLRKYIKKTYKMTSESGAIGLGVAEVVIGGKR
jgi:Family of unknown function (DUF6175)